MNLLKQIYFEVEKELLRCKENKKVKQKCKEKVIKLHWEHKNQSKYYTNVVRGDFHLFQRISN